MRDEGAPRFRLRVTSGPLTGARFRLHDAVTIGRSSQVEIFVADAGVSRRHAKVFPSADGMHVLIDLGSANGTLVDGQAVSEIKLEEGTAFTVGGTTFVYEAATTTQPVAPDRGVYAVRGDGNKGPLERTVVALGDEPHKASAIPKTTAWKRIEARCSDGQPYPGDLVGDVILYRNLRLRAHRRDDLPAAARCRFEELDERLRQPPGEHDPCARVFGRFSCSFPARIRFSRSEGGGHPVEVVDFGVAGARVRCRGLPLEVDELVWVAIDLVSREGSRTIVFTARVVWQNTEEIGVVFSGAPGWSRHDTGTEGDDTLLLQRDPPAAARRMKLRTVRLRMASNGDSDDGV